MGAYIGLDILVLEVEGVLPDVDTDNGEMAQKRVLVGCRGNLKLLRRLVIPYPAPTGTLDTRGGSIDLFFELCTITIKSSQSGGVSLVSVCVEDTYFRQTQSRVR